MQLFQIMLLSNPELDGQKLYTGTFSGNSAIISYMKKKHLKIKCIIVLELIKCPDFIFDNQGLDLTMSGKTRVCL